MKRIAVACSFVFFLCPQIRICQPDGGAAEKQEPAASGMDALELVKVVYVPFRLRIVRHNVNPNNPAGAKVQIQSIDRQRRHHVLDVGDDVPDTKFKIEAFKKMERPGKDGITEDASELTIINKETGAKVVLPLKGIVDSPDSYAIFRYKWTQAGKPQTATPDFAKRAGETFTLPPETEKKYKVIEIKGQTVVIELPDGTRRTLAVPKAPLPP